MTTYSVGQKVDHRLLVCLEGQIGLVCQNHFDEIFVVDVSGGILLPVDQHLCLLLGHLLAQRGQHVAQLGARDVTVAVLKTKTLFLFDFDLAKLTLYFLFLLFVSFRLSGPD